MKKANIARFFFFFNEWGWAITEYLRWSLNHLEVISSNFLLKGCWITRVFWGPYPIELWNLMDRDPATFCPMLQCVSEGNVTCSTTCHPMTKLWVLHSEDYQEHFRIVVSNYFIEIAQFYSLESILKLQGYRCSGYYEKLKEESRIL